MTASRNAGSAQHNEASRGWLADAKIALVGDRTCREMRRGIVQWILEGDRWISRV
jgi:hypothetical protein